MGRLRQGSDRHRRPEVGLEQPYAAASVPRGAVVIGVDLNGGALVEMAEAVRCASGRVSTLCADVADEDAAAAAVGSALADFRRLHVLVSNAVHDLPLAPVTSISLADWRRTFAVNLDSDFLFSKHAIPAMPAGGGGSIILVASQLARVVRPGRPGTAPPKELWCNSQEQWRWTMPTKVRVNSLSPGPVETARYLRNFETLAAARNSYNTFAGAARHPDEIANGAVFLASDESAFVTGSDLLVDGGYTAV